MGQTGILTLVWQLVWEKENSESRPVNLCLKMWSYRIILVWRSRYICIYIYMCVCVCVCVCVCECVCVWVCVCSIFNFSMIIDHIYLCTYLNLFNTLSARLRICRQYPLRRIKITPKEKPGCPGYYSKQHLMVRLQF